MSELLERLRDFEPEPECDNAELEMLLDDVADKLREDVEEIKRLREAVDLAYMDMKYHRTQNAETIRVLESIISQDNE